MSVWTHELDPHFISNDDRKQLDKIANQITHEYNEIKADIEDNELRYNLTFTRPFSSYLIPKDPNHLERERRLYLERLAHVPTVPDLLPLANEFEEELNTCSSTISDFTPESLPLLLQAFYLKRLSTLTYAKALHCVRWKRFCRQQIDFIQVEQQFKDRSARILAEFNDALQRSHRLAAIRETLLFPSNSTSTKNFNQPVINDDYVAYIRFLVCHYRGQKYFDQLAELIRIIHLKFRARLSTDTQTLTVNLQLPISPFETSIARASVPTIELEQKQTLDKLNVLLRLYALPLDTSKIQTSGDEMELYANIIRYYRTIFLEQERDRPSILYDAAKPKVLAQARQSTSCQLIKKAFWVPFVTIKPELDSQRERDYWKYIRGGKHDELLATIARFIHVRNAEKAASVLKQYLLALKAKKSTALKQVLDSSTSTPSQAAAMADMFWKNIFELVPLNSTGENEQDNSDNEELQDSYEFQDNSARSSRYMKRDEFNYLETLQKLGLDDTSGHRRDSDTEGNDASESYGLQLSYLTLRLLRIRTLRHRCLHELNYFRSIQRTLTIYEQRLIMSSKGKEFHTIDQRFHHHIPHTYLFDTPHQCTFDRLHFMQTEEHIDNVEDFAQEVNIDHDGSIIHVQDSTGLYIVYDCAFDDVNALEEEIVSIGSFFIEKAGMKHVKSDSHGDFLRKIDRFEILYHLWDYELTYLQCKRQLIDCFYEIYQHTFDSHERYLISQTIADLVARRPRIDFRNDDYFSHSYSLEIRYLQQYSSLLREYLHRHVNDIRQVTENLFDSTDYGAYFPSARSQSSPPIYLSISKIHSYYLFEFLESLSSLTRLPHLLKDTFDELIEFEQIQRQTNFTLTERMLFELEYLDEISTHYKQLDQPGSLYLPNHQRDVFNSLFSDHPTLMGKFAYEILKQIDEARTTKKEQYDKYIKLNTSLIELITLRYRLIRSASDCELLTMVYKQQLDVMGIDHSHLFLRFVQFEFAQTRTVNNEFEFDTSFIPDGRLDKITGQQYLLFAVQELEEGSIGRMNFRQKDQWLTMINEGDDAISNLKVAVRLQLMHNHFVHTAILQHRIAVVCITQQLQTAKPERKTEPTKSVSIGKRYTADAKQTDQSSSLLNNVLYENARRKLFRENYFVSIQFEKSPCRDRILNEFLRQRELKPMQYQQVREAEKLKRSLLNDFIDRVHQRDALILLRLQIIQSYLSMSFLVHQFPLTSRTHFMWPKAIPPPLPTSAIASTTDLSESATPSPTLTTNQTSNGYQLRPKMILNETGSDLVNLWYIPSFMEQLRIFKNANLDINEVEKRLKDLLRIVSSLNDLVHIVVGFAQLNSATTNAEQRFNDRTYDLSTFDQSGEFSSELHEIQREIDASSSMSLSTIADLLETKRRLVIFQIYYCLSYPIPQCFLIGKNPIAFDLIRSRSSCVLPRLVSDYERYKPLYSILPQPLLPVQDLSKRLYPWTVHQSEHNITAQRLWWPKYHLIDPIHISLIGLKPQELALANAELVSVGVMLQNIDEIIRAKDATNNMQTIIHRKDIPTGDHLFKYFRLELHIAECIRMEIVREAWNRTKLNAHAIDSVKKFDDAFASFRDEIRSPVLRQLSTAVGYSTFYNDFPMALHNGQLAPNVSEYQLKQALTIRMLVELEGKYMMNDTLKRLKRERTLVVSERLREESGLPTDLWKKQQFTENFSVTRPHIVDDLGVLLTQYEYKDEQSTFITAPTGHLEEPSDVDSTVPSHTSEIYSIRRSDLTKCLKEIGSRTMQREHENYLSYSYHYENLLYNTRQMIGQRENEIKNLRFQIQDQQFSLELDSQLLTLSAYFDLITQLIQFRSVNSQLQLDKQLRFDKELTHIRERFQSINEQLLNTNFLLRSRFEQYREQLYNSTITIIKEIRTEIYNMARAKLTSDAKSIIDQQHFEQKKLIDDLQEELHRAQEKQSTENYERERQARKDLVELEKNIAHLQYQLDHYQKRYVYKTTKQLEEIQSLKRTNNYLRKRITTNETHYKRIFESESRSESKANMERDDDRRQAINQKQIIETRLRWMQEQKDQLVRKDQELEKKTNQLEGENLAMHIDQVYVKRDLLQTKKKLEKERSLKTDAIEQVKTLRNNLNEIEEELEHIALNDGANSFISASVAPPPSRTLGSARAITPYQILLSRNRPMTSVSAYRDKQRFTNSRLRCYSSTPTKRVQTANVHIEKITPLTEELLSNLGAATSPTTPSVKMLRIKSAKT